MRALFVLYTSDEPSLPEYVPASESDKLVCQRRKVPASHADDMSTRLGFRPAEEWTIAPRGGMESGVTSAAVGRLVDRILNFSGGDVILLFSGTTLLLKRLRGRVTLTGQPRWAPLRTEIERGQWSGRP